MKSKLFLLPLAVLMMASCGSQPAPTPEDKLLEDKSVAGWVVHGNHLLADGTTANGWNGKSNELYESTKMTAMKESELKAVTEIQSALTGKTVKYAYTYDVVLGCNASGWSSNSMVGTKMYEGDGSRCLKATKCTYDGEDQVWAEQQWIPDPHTAHPESLTPDTLFLGPWQETPDDHGFSWSSNPMCIGKAGLYKFVVVEYQGQASTAAQYGLGLVFKEEKTPAQDVKPFQEVQEFVVADHTYGVIGGFNEWGADVAMTVDPDNALLYTAKITTTEANTEIKVRADGEWTHSWGADGYNGANVVIAEPGEWKISIGFATAKTRDAVVSVEDPSGFVVANHTYGVIGLNGDWENDIPMTVDPDNALIYKAEVDSLDITSFKVRADGAWDINWGEDGVINGENISIRDAGKYLVSIIFEAAIGTKANITCVPANK